MFGIIFLVIYFSMINAMQNNSNGTKVIYKYLPYSYNQDINNPSFVTPLYDKMASQQTIWVDSVNENEIRKRESLNKYFISGN